MSRIPTRILPRINSWWRFTPTSKYEGAVVLVDGWAKNADGTDGELELSIFGCLQSNQLGPLGAEELEGLKKLTISNFCQLAETCELIYIGITDD